MERGAGETYDRLAEHLETMAARIAAAELVITRVFDAPRELVFECWTEPEHLRHWQGAPRGFTVTSHETDIRPGGFFRICMRSPDGVEHWLEGDYREMVKPERLVIHAPLAGRQPKARERNAGDDHAGGTRRQDRAHVATERFCVGRIARWAQVWMDQRAGCAGRLPG